MVDAGNKQIKDAKKISVEEKTKVDDKIEKENLKNAKVDAETSLSTINQKVEEIKKSVKGNNKNM